MKQVITIATAFLAALLLPTSSKAGTRLTEINVLSDSFNPSIQTILERDSIVGMEVLANGDTVYRYAPSAIDLGSITSQWPMQETPRERVRTNRPNDFGIPKFDNYARGDAYVGEIPFQEGVSPTGGKTYSIPITTTKCCGTTPKISIVYNSQSANGTAGYGWNVVGISSIMTVGKTIVFDGDAAPVDLTKPDECRFALDGVRLVPNTGRLQQYDYITSQGLTLVKKHFYGEHIAYFTVVYPNGITATFGFKNNAKTRHVYPLTEMTDLLGYKINFTYIESNNCYHLSRITYGGKTETDHYGLLVFNYVNRTDCAEAFFDGLGIKPNKLLKEVVSQTKKDGKFETLSTYKLTHDLKGVNLLTRIDCSSDGVALPPLQFTYGDAAEEVHCKLQKGEQVILPKYFAADVDSKTPIFVRGKFMKNHYTDGLLTMPGHFHQYQEIRGNVFGSGYPADQDMLIIPCLSFPYENSTIKTESGFQTIQAVDTDGDGVDELVKVNFGGLWGDNTNLKITTYRHDEGKFTSQSFITPARGVVNKHGETYSPMSRIYLFGDFMGKGKAQLLTITHNKTFLNDDVTSWFTLIDLSEKKRVSETTLFPLTFGSKVFVLDVDGDGKMELCHAVSNGMDVYGFSIGDNRFAKRFRTLEITDNILENAVFGDINGDGKIDIMTPPRESFLMIDTRIVPVWSPGMCFNCKKIYPIESPSGSTCVRCHANLKRMAIESGGGRCCGCGASLRRRGDHPNSVDLICPKHGSCVEIKITKGYMDNGNVWTIYRSTGKGFSKQSTPIVKREKDDKYLMMDVDKDGYADLLCTRNGYTRLFLNKNGRVQDTVCCDLSFSGKTQLLPTNINNPKGASHLVAINNEKVACYDFTVDESANYLLTGMANSYGIVQHNRYDDMIAEHSNYVPSRSRHAYPYSSFMAPLRLVSSIITYRNRTMLKHLRYAYRGAVTHRTGLGFMGFEETLISEGISGNRTVEYRDLEHFGITTRTETRDRDVELYYANTNFTAAKTCNPVLTRSVETNKLTGVKKETQLFYDAFNNPTRQRISFGNGNIYTESVQTYRNVTTSDRYLVGLPLAKVTTSGRDGNTWTTREEYAYNAQWMPERSITYTNGNKTGETRWTYDAHGNVTSEKSAPYNVTELLGNTYTYDAIGRNLLTKTNALGQTTTYAEYDKWGQAHRITDHKGRTTTIVTDAWGKPVSTTSPDGITTTTTTAWGGKGLYTIARTITGKPKTIVHYDALEREVRKGNMRFDGKWQFVDNAYDYKGRLAKTSLPFKGDAPALWTTYEYDDYDRLVKQTEASGKTTTWSYAGLSVTETKEGIASTKTTDAIGELIKVEDPGGTITYTLRPDGQPSAITAPGNVVTTFEYDGFGRRTAIVDPSAGKQTFTEKYDNSGICTSTVTDARGKTVTTIKDKYGRTIQINRPEFNVSYTYNKDGQLEREEYSDRRAKSYSYDALGRVAHSLDDVSGIDVGFTYKDGNVASIKYNSRSNPNGVEMKEAYLYTNGHRTEVKFNDYQSVWKLIEENDLGQPTQIATGSLVRTYSYSNIGLPTRQTAGKVQDVSYNFDVQTGNLLSRTDNRRNITETFGYDKLNRLCQIGTQQVKYADNGNVLEMPGMGVMGYDNAAKPYQVTAFTPIGNNVPTREQQITYNSFQCPDKITENGYSASFSYDAEGDRAEMTIRKGNDEVLTRQYIDARYEIDNSFTERFYLGGDAYDALAVCVNDFGVDSTYYILRDYLGNITHIINEDGTLRQELSYDAWGRLRNPDTHQLYAVGKEPKLLLDRGYTGHEYLPWFGLINMNARLYDPVLGRFLSPDPYVQMPDFTQNFNRYSYCLNNPLKYVDKDGEFFHLIIGAIVGGIFNWASHGFQFNAKGLGYFAVGAIAGAVGAGIGAGISSAIAGGSFGAGFIGSSAAMTATSSFVTGVAIGSGYGFSSGFINGFGNGLMDGQNLGQALWNGTKEGFIGGVSGALLGGIEGGIDAVADGRNFWHGGRKTLDVSLPIQQVNQVEEFDCNYACAESVDRYYGNGRGQSDFKELMNGKDQGLKDMEIGKLYGKAGYAARPIPIKTSRPISTVSDIASTMSAKKAVVLNYETGVSGGINSAGQKIAYAHATVITRVRMYDNGRFVINVMNPGGSVTRFTTFKRFHLIFGVY